MNENGLCVNELSKIFYFLKDFISYLSKINGSTLINVSGEGVTQHCLSYHNYGKSSDHQCAAMILTSPFSGYRWNAVSLNKGQTTVATLLSVLMNFDQTNDRKTKICFDFGVMNVETIDGCIIVSKTDKKFVDRLSCFDKVEHIIQSDDKKFTSLDEIFRTLYQFKTEIESDSGYDEVDFFIHFDKINHKLYNWPQFNELYPNFELNRFKFHRFLIFNVVCKI